jgi:aldose sugar dehydrogenase
MIPRLWLSRRARVAAAGVLALVVAVTVPLVVVRSHRGGQSPQAQATHTPTLATATPSPSATPSPTATPQPTPPVAAGTSVATAPGCASVPGGPPGGTFPANFATALAFAPDGRLFYTERSGTVRVVEAGTAHVFATVSTVTTERGGSYSERGLLGLAISPTFTTDHFVYALYDLTDYAHEDVVRWTDCGGTGTQMTTLIALPSGADCCHKGGRLVFGSDGKLYVTLGEEHSAPAAQDVHDVRGKVLRYNPDGSVPADNPFGAGDPVWAYGLRNPFGIAFSASGTLIVTNNGPSGDAGSPSTGYDTVDTIVRGAGYQWPYCYGYSHPISPNTGCNGEREPDWSSESQTVVPTGATFVDQNGPAAYAGRFVVCTYAQGGRVLVPGSPHASVVNGPSGCTLDVKEGPDHALYYSDTGHIYRLT